MNVLHALAVLFTVLLFFIRQQFFVMGAVCPAKRVSVDGIECPRGDSPIVAQMALPTGRVCATGACAIPKCKRDPDLIFDNEYLGVYPTE